MPFSTNNKISGLRLFSEEDCDWSGQIGDPPTLSELCQAHQGYHTQSLYQCKQEIQPHGPQCDFPREDRMPKIWRQEGSLIKRGTYCSITQQVDNKTLFKSI